MLASTMRPHPIFKMNSNNPAIYVLTSRLITTQSQDSLIIIYDNYLTIKGAPGFDPGTFRSAVGCSTTELYPLDYNEKKGEIKKIITFHQVVGERTGSSANDSMEEIKQFPFRKLCQRPSLTKYGKVTGFNHAR